MFKYLFRQYFATILIILGIIISSTMINYVAVYYTNHGPVVFGITAFGGLCLGLGLAWSTGE